MTTAVDTNVVLRWITRDDPVQAALADPVFDKPVVITTTVLLETEWVLRGRRYAMQRNTIATLLEQIAETTTVTREHENGARWALERYRLGTDFADMIHLVVPAEASRFVTFDRRLARHAGTDAPLAIETLA